MKAVSDRFEALLYSCLYLDGASSKTALISASERLWRLAIRSTLTPSERSTQICRFSLFVIIIVPPICRHDCRTQHPHDAADNQADDKCNYRTQSFSLLVSVQNLSYKRQFFLHAFRQIHEPAVVWRRFRRLLRCFLRAF